MYSRLCLNPYLSVDSPGYGVLESMYYENDIQEITKKKIVKNQKKIKDMLLIELVLVYIKDNL